MLERWICANVLIFRFFQVKVFDDKGRGVIANRLFERGDFVVEYSGDLIHSTEAKRRELIYAQDRTKGCYMYYFKHGNLQYW